MKAIMLFVALVLLVGCTNSSEQGAVTENPTRKMTASLSVLPDPGKALLEKNCYACHNATATMENRLAPPMIAVKQHYLMGGTTKEEFTNAIKEWVKDPSAEKSRMPGALNKFGVMPYQEFSEETIEQIAHYIYENDLEKPACCDTHQKGKNGKMAKNCDMCGDGTMCGKGQMKGKGRMNGTGKMSRKGKG